MNSKHYRADIDGLRAIAVLGVILFHAGVGLEGGYVGVDVFFVISGYLIAQILLRETQAGGFSIRQFWVRRIKRILPASSFVTLVTLSIGYLVLDPDSYLNLSESAIAHSLMVANVFFWRSGGYFSEAAELQPLLHMWSLAVEEQFYLFFPIIMIFFARRQKQVISVIVAFTVVSFAICLIGVYVWPSATFFLIPTRAWELSIGVLLALAESKLSLSKKYREVFSVLGGSMIAAAMLLYSESTPFPGVAASAPVFGSVMLLFANRTQDTFMFRFLSNKILVGIGLASYSLYLWHWPILVFCNHMFIEVHWLISTLQLVLIAAVSYLSWRFIELPFRKSQLLAQSRYAFIFASVVTLIAFTSGIFVCVKNGFKERFEDMQMAIFHDITWRGIEYEDSSVDGVLIGRDDGGEDLDFIFWGDSHGMALAKTVDELANETGLNGIAYLSPGRAPITNLWKPAKGAERQKETTKINEDRLEWILQSKVRHVILVARWQGMIDGLLETELEPHRGVLKNFSMVTDTTEVTSPDREHSMAAFERQYGRMVKLLAENGVKVWTLLQVPHASRPRVARDYYLATRYPKLNREFHEWGTTRFDYTKERETIVEIISNFETDKIAIVDPVEAFYGEHDKLRLFADRALYRDEDHLSRAGADYYLRDVFKKLFHDISKDM